MTLAGILGGSVTALLYPGLIGIKTEYATNKIQKFMLYLFTLGSFLLGLLGTIFCLLEFKSD